MEYIPLENRRTSSDDVLQRRLRSAQEDVERLEKENKALRSEVEGMSAFEELLDTGRLSDFTILAGPTKSTLKVHKVVICLESEFFRKCCSPPWKEGQEGRLELVEISDRIMRIILSYCYKGLRLPAEDYNVTQLKKLMEAADYLIMPKLKEKVAMKIVKLTRAILSGAILSGDVHGGNLDPIECFKVIMENYTYFRDMMLIKRTEEEDGNDHWSGEIEGLVRQVGIAGMVDLLLDEDVRAFMEDNGGFGLWLWDVFISQAQHLQDSAS